MPQLPPPLITIGGPHPNVHAFVAAPGVFASGAGPAVGALQPVGAPGELLLSGPCMAHGYVSRPDLTAAAFVPNPFFSLVEAGLPADARRFFQRAYRTGDLVRWRPDGTIEFMGRIDSQVRWAAGPGLQGSMLHCSPVAAWLLWLDSALPRWPPKDL